MYHLFVFLSILASATSEGNFSFIDTHVIVSETPFSQATFRVSRTGQNGDRVVVTCQVSSSVPLNSIKLTVSTWSSKLDFRDAKVETFEFWESWIDMWGSRLEIWGVLEYSSTSIRVRLMDYMQWSFEEVMVD